MRWFLEAHAAQRMKEMGLDRNAIVNTVNHPETDYPSSEKKGCRIATRGELAVVYHPDERTVITILWHKGESRDAGPQV